VGAFLFGDRCDDNAAMTGSLTDVYRRYLDCLNHRRWEDLADFVCDDVTYNGEPLGGGGYRTMLERDTHAVPDLRFTPDLLVADGDTVACRLLFRCTPERLFFEFTPTGARITFAEHVFYRFRDARIAEVWSLIDTRAIAAQLGG
jgi:predicted ester cyclase